MTPKYMKTWRKQRKDYNRSGKAQRDIKHEFITREIEDKMFALQSSDRSYWAYVNDSSSRKDLMIFDVLEGSNSQIKQLSVRSGRGIRPMYVSDLKWRKSKNVIMQVDKVVILHHIDDGDNYPDATGPVNLVYEGIKEGHKPKVVREQEMVSEPQENKIYTKEEAETKIKELGLNLSIFSKMGKETLERALINRLKLINPGITQEELNKLLEPFSDYFKEE